MGSAEKFCLRWNDFDTNIRNTFEELRKAEEFCDVSLCCDGFGEPNAPERLLKAHKVVLSACSPFFRDVLIRLQHANSQMHPVVYLRGVKRSDLRHILDFMYFGEVNVAQEDLTSFLAVAEDLKIKGLTNNDHTKEARSTVVKAAKHKMSDPIDTTRRGNNVKRGRPAKQSTSTSIEVAADVSNMGDDDDDEIQIEEVSMVKKEGAESKVFAQGGAEHYPQEGDEDYEDYSQYEGEEGDDDFGSMPLDETGEGTSDGTKGPTSPSLADKSRLAADVACFMESLSARNGKGYQCLACSCQCRDWYDQREHVLTHIKNNPDLVDRLDSYIQPNIIKQSPSVYSCMYCRKLIRRGMFKVRSHFVSKHLSC